MRRFTYNQEHVLLNLWANGSALRARWPDRRIGTHSLYSLVRRGLVTIDSRSPTVAEHRAWLTLDGLVAAETLNAEGVV